MHLFQYREQGRHQLGLLFGQQTGPHGINLTLALQQWQREKLGREHPPIERMEQLIEEYADLSSLLRDVIKLARGNGLLLLHDPPELLPPLTRPRKILCLGRNYAKHAAERGSEVPGEPMYFNKVSDCIIGPNDIITIPRRFGRVDPEIELAVVIGRPGFEIPREKAMDYVAGYTILNDVSARELQAKAKEKRYPWFPAKNYATFCPIGPYLTLADTVPDPHNLEMTLTVNGEVRQQENTGRMIFSIPVLIETLSLQLPLMPGDIIATGTPHGVAPLADGDRVEMSIESLGSLVNKVREV